MSKPSHAERARTLASQISAGALSTCSVRTGGTPFGSQVITTLSPEGDPLFLLSELTEHTKNLRADPRCSLLLAESGDHPLALGRVTLLGEASPTDAPSARTTFLEAHLDAARYASFGDFSFWRLSVASVRYVGGFGRMSWIEGAAWRAAEADPLAAHAAGIIAHMNDDHVAAMVLYCEVLAGVEGTVGATMVGVDRYGFDLSAEVSGGRRAVRLDFEEPVNSPGEVRRALVALAQRARGAG
jgi:putative heme iron utilization protein